jgi:hypothetical protein
MGFASDGFAVMGGLFSVGELDDLQGEMDELQRRAGAGELDADHGGTQFLAPFEGERPPFVHYVSGLVTLSPRASAALAHPSITRFVSEALGSSAYLWDYDDHGVVYQDARPGDEMRYTRIGWHSDHQSRPTSDIWPGVAVTIHLDATSPANGFLRVVPGSHRWPTDEMPLRFDKIPGEVAVYCDRGDVLFHHSDLWHSAARATEDAPDGVRRHIRANFLGGRRLGPDETLEEFNKNAAR